MPTLGGTRPGRYRTMNRYGRMAFDHVRQHEPKSFAALPDPTSHFSRLGEEIEGGITALTEQLLGPIQEGESLEDYRQRSYQARRQAEEIVLAETVWTEPEAGPTSEDEHVLAYRARLSMVSRTLSSVDRDWLDPTPDPPTQP
jgi:hypothetical protein